MTTWNYNSGANTLAATFATTPGLLYELSSNDGGSSAATGTASGSSLTLTVTGMSGPASGDFFDAYITENTGANYVDGNAFKWGTSSLTGESQDATWTFNGTTGFSVQFAAPTVGHSYQAIVNYIGGSNFLNTGGGTQTGTSNTTCTVTAGSSIDSSTIIRLVLEDVTTFQVHAVRIFTAGSAGGGSAGTPGGPFSGGGLASSGMRLTPMPRVPSLERRVSRVAVRARNLERRFISEPPDSVAGPEFISQVSFSVANGGVHVCSFTKTGGPTLFDLTTPTAPAVLVGGIYFVLAEVETGGFSSLGYCTGDLKMDAAGTPWGPFKHEYPTGSGREAHFPLDATGYLPAGATIQVSVDNFDGTNAVTFTVELAIQRIS